MRKRLFIFQVLVICSIGWLYAQKNSDLKITIPDVEIADSKYRNLQYIESRPNPDDMGVLYVDIWNGLQMVTAKEPIAEQLKPIVNLMSPSEDAKTLAVQMRVLFFEQGTKETKGKNMGHLRMTLYKMDGDKYYFLNTLDTTLLDGSAGKIRTITGDAIVSFITDNLPYDVFEDEQALDMQQVMDIDMYERNSIPFYTELNIPDGIYNNYKSLKSLTPDNPSPVTVTKADGDDLKEVKIPDPENPDKEKKVKAKDVYAVVVDGIPFIAFSGSFHKAYLKDSDWRFVISRKVAGSGFALGVSMGGGGRHGGGAVGFGIPIGGKKENIEMFIDQLNGAFFFGKKVDR